MRRGVIAAGLSVGAHVALAAGVVLLMRAAPPAAPRGEEAVGFAVETVTARGEGGTAQEAAPAPAPVAAPAVAPRAKRRVVEARVEVSGDPGRDEQETGDGKQETGNGGETQGDGSGEEKQATGNGGGGGGEGPRATGNSGPDGESIRRLVERVVGYPRVARRQGLEGRVVVRFRIDETGQAHEVSVVESAGVILDDAARDAVVRAAPYPTTPGWVRVPVDFSLRSAR